MLKWLLVATIGFAAPALAASCAPPPGYDAFALKVADLTNALRKKKRRKALHFSATLTEAAQEHACYMAATGQMSHTGANGSQVQNRVEAVGYSWRFIAENVAMGQPFPDSVVAAWRNSAGHRKNMLHKRARDIGIGVAVRDGRPFWVMVLGNQG